MKLLIGIMRTIENEFEACIAAINSQTHKDFEYFVVENLPNKEAHNKLYQTFMNKSKDYDFFIKIDADMVLYRKDFFSLLIEEFNKHKEINHILMKVYDLFTEQLIFGLHAFSSKIQFNISKNENIFVDIVFQETKILTIKEAFHQLIPAALHCPNPSAFQSFHYGLHKVVKILQIENLQKDRDSAYSHAKNIWKIYSNYRIKKKENYLYALLGAFWALNNQISSAEVDFNSIKTKEAFGYYLRLTPKFKSIQIKYYVLKYFLFLSEAKWTELVLRSYIDSESKFSIIGDIIRKRLLGRLKKNENG